MNLNRLIKLADDLDANGFRREADMLDEIIDKEIKKAAITSATTGPVRDVVYLKREREKLYKAMQGLKQERNLLNEQGKDASHLNDKFQILVRQIERLDGQLRDAEKQHATEVAKSVTRGAPQTQEDFRSQSEEGKRNLNLQRARANAHKIDWNRSTLTKDAFKSANVDTGLLRALIRRAASSSSYLPPEYARTIKMDGPFTYALYWILRYLESRKLISLPQNWSYAFIRFDDLGVDAPSPEQVVAKACQEIENLSRKESGYDLREAILEGKR